MSEQVREPLRLFCILGSEHLDGVFPYFLDPFRGRDHWDLLNTIARGRLRFATEDANHLHPGLSATTIPKATRLRENDMVAVFSRALHGRPGAVHVVLNRVVERRSTSAIPVVEAVWTRRGPPRFGRLTLGEATALNYLNAIGRCMGPRGFGGSENDDWVDLLQQIDAFRIHSEAAMNWLDHNRQAVLEQIDRLVARVNLAPDVRRKTRKALRAMTMRVLLGAQEDS